MKKFCFITHKLLNIISLEIKKKFIILFKYLRTKKIKLFNYSLFIFANTNKYLFNLEKINVKNIFTYKFNNKEKNYFIKI